MTPATANLLLDRVREGQIYDFEQITAALIATGDLAGWRETHLVGSLAAGMRSQGVGQAVQTETQPGMVGADQAGHPQGAWPGWSRYLDC